MTIFITTFLHTAFLIVVILGCSVPLLAFLNVSYGLGAARHILDLTRGWSMSRLDKMPLHLSIFAMNLVSLYFQFAMLLQSIGIANVHGKVLVRLSTSTDFHDVAIERIGIIPTFSAHILGFALPVLIGRHMILNMSNYYKSSTPSTRELSNEDSLSDSEQTLQNRKNPQTKL
jgi:hypothetical protein